MTAEGMVKLFSPGDWGNGDNTEDNQIKIAANGLQWSDKLAAKKFASDELLHWLSRMKTDPDGVYVHKVAMSGSDRFGPNRWGDGFREDILKRDVGTFETYAKAFRHHKSDKAPFYGKPKIARLRDDLGTVELVTEYYGTDKMASANGGHLADLELQSLAKLGHIPVSMGSHVPGDQCFPPGTLITTDRGLVPIERVQVGDQVVTHRSRLRKVTKTGQRIHRGQMVAIKPCNHLEPLLTSDEHPYYVLRKSDVRHPAGRRRSNLESCKPQWVAAKDVEAGDFVLSPVFDKEPVDTLDVARLFGCYAGNGSRIIQKTGRKKDGPYRLMGFSISGNLTQPEIMQDIRDVIGRVATNFPTLKEEPHRSAYDLRTYDQHMANRLVSECGDLCKNKRVPAYLYTASIAERLAFIGGLIDTDGSVDRKSGQIRIPLTTSRLVLDTYLLGLSCGLRGSVSQHTSAGFNGEGTVETTVVGFGASHYDELSQHSWKVKNWGCRRTPSSVAFAYEFESRSYVAMEVASVQIACDELVVHNFSVEEDESYVAEGVTVHNCKICDHWAKTRQQHCLSKKEGGTCTLFGCRNGMLKIAADGRQQYVDNPLNCFFDISYVTQGADPVANGLLLPLGMFADDNDRQRKVAEFSDKLASYVPSEIRETTGYLSTTHRAAMQLAYVWADMESKLATAEIDDLDSGLVTAGDVEGLHTLFSSAPRVRAATIKQLAKLAICPSFEAFAKAAGLNEWEIKLASEYVPNAYTRVIREGVLDHVLRSINLEKNLPEYLVEVKQAGIDTTMTRAAVLRRSLLGNAEGVQVAQAKTAGFENSTPSVVVDYATFKLAWACQAELNPWIIQAMAKREFLKLERDS